MHESMKDIQLLTKKLTVLYVEDEESIRSQMLDILGLFFDKVITACDGEEGYKLSEKHYFDLIITDIQMPRLSGLEMIEKIHEKKPNVPVVITTAFNDQEYFLKSIDLRVDKYLIKPIMQKQAQDVLYSVAKMIDDRTKAKEFEIKKMQDKINHISQHLVSEITNSYQNPCIVYTNGDVRYMNDSFCSLFDPQDLKSYIKDGILFDTREGFIWLLSEYDEENISKNRVSISNKKGRKIYRVQRKSIELDEDKTVSTIYLFNDITLEEYQKIKIKSYTEILEEFIFKTRYRAKKEHISDKVIEKEVETPIPTQIIEELDDKPKLNIRADENELLRRSHTYKTTAKDYVDELDSEILSELQELDELDKDFGDSIILLQEDANVDGIHNMSSQLQQYAHEISLLFEFEDLAYAIRSLSEVLASIEASKLDDKKMKKLVLFLAGIQSDLSDWRKLLFIEQSALDIHYLDSSLYSACLQIELVLSDDVKEMESEEDDLVLF